MKNIIKGERGVTLISLAATVIIVGIITTMLLYSIKDTDQVGKLTNLYTDIDNLKDKASTYYATYGKLPALPSTRIDVDNKVKADFTEDSNNPIGFNDEGKFLVIDLNALENLTLNYGEDFKKIEAGTPINQDNDKDLYVINEQSHNVFYWKGVVADGKKYYTNQDKDTEKIDIRYVNNIKIPEGYEYYSGGKDSPMIVVSKTDDSDYYQWCDIENGSYVLKKEGNDLTLRRADLEDISANRMTIDFDDSNEIENLLKSAYEFNGFYIKLSKSGDNFSIYINENDKIEAKYFSIDYTNSWSATYDEEGIYKDKNGDTAYIPKGFQVSKLKLQNTIKQGLVARRVSGEGANQKITEFVWIEVPKTALKDINGNEPNTPDEMEQNLINYAKDYRQEGYQDAWFSGVIGQSGAGSGTENINYNTMKNKMIQSISQKGGFWISRNEILDNHDVAQNNMAYVNATKEAIDMLNTTYEANGDTKIGLGLDTQMYQTSLLFGIQWDLTCKFIGENPNTESLIKSLNIVNLEGNVAEFTMEKSPVANTVVVRGGTGDAENRNFSIRSNFSNSTLATSSDIGFRITLY